jgi:hypothetical protein
MPPTRRCSPQIRRARVEKLAEEIVARGPLLVGLQEAFLIRTGKSTSPPTSATQVQVDYLGMLLEDLENLGHPYVAVATLPGIDAQAPSTTGQDVRVTDQTVIIAAQTPELTITDQHVENFLINLPVLVPALGTTLTDLKGWASVNAKIDGGAFRFVTTHLENLVPGLPFGGAAIQLAQAAELVEVAGAPDRPVIMAADFNANASSTSDPSNLTYKILVQGGTNGKFTDAWKQLHPTDPGYTCCQAANLQNPVSQLSQRIDLVLYRGPIRGCRSVAGRKSPDRSHADDPAIVAVRSRRARSDARRKNPSLTGVVITTRATCRCGVRADRSTKVADGTLYVVILHLLRNRPPRAVLR